MKKITFAIILLISIGTYSQKHELGEVTIEELQEKVCPTDSSAVAAVLFEIGKTYFDFSEANGFELVTETTVKIKIYKKEGYEYANQTFKMYDGSSGAGEKIDISKAYTYNLVNNKIEKTKLNSDGQFSEQYSKNWKLKKITMPNVKEGSIIEYKVILRSDYLSHIDEWAFQRYIPVNYSEFSTYIPEYYVFNTRNKGYLSPKITTDKKEKTHTFTVKEKNEGLNTGPTNSRISTQSLKYQETKTTYILKDVPALKEEAYVNNMENYRATLIHELTSRRFPNKPYENYSTDWETVVKTIYDNENFGSELNKTGYFEKDLDAILNGVNVQNERIFAVFNYVKSRMNWDETYGILCDKGVKKAYQDQKGNDAEINLMLVAMLRYAGIEASPILISTRSNGLAIFPSRTAFNYVIAGVELPDQVILLDATDKYSLPDILPIRDLNWFGRIIRKNESSALINLMPKSNSKDIITIMAAINDQGEVSGKVREQYFDYNAFLYRDNYNAVAKDSYVEKLEKRHQGLEIEDYDVQNSNDLSKPITESYAFKTNNSVEIIGDKMYFSPFLFFAQTENVFKQEIREYPIDFIYPNQDKYMIIITIPEGYAIETTPMPKAIAMPDEIGSFNYKINGDSKQVQLVYTLDINQAVIQADYYEELKMFFKEMVNSQTEKIALKKI